MTPFDELVAKRRSIRKYRPEMPADDMIEQMVRAALTAPSPSNSRPVRFVRLLSDRLRERLREGMAAGQDQLTRIAAQAGRPNWMKNRVRFYNRHMEFMFEAPVLMAVAVLRPAEAPDAPERLLGARAQGVRLTGRHLSAGLSVMSYLLKGEELGLGSCILSAPLLFVEEPERLLGLEEMDLLCFITTGYPAEGTSPVKEPAIEEMYLCRS